MNDDPYTVIRNEVAALLQLDVDHLTVRERMRLDLFATAKFEFDASVARLRAGGQVDPARLAEVVDMLDRMIDRYVPVASSEKVNTPGSNAWRRKLEAKILARVKAAEAEEAEQIERENVELENTRAENERLRAENVELRAAAAMPAALSSDLAKPAPLPQVSSQPPLPHKDAPIPRNYLQRENPWAAYTDSDPNWMCADRWGKIGTR
jgi:hypothetical protein